MPEIRIPLARMIENRRALHMYPELGYDLPRTTALVKSELERIGVPYTEAYGPSSVVAVINAHKTAFTIGLRADMDALPITEKTGAPYASRIDGHMHACGHDAHTAMMLGTAEALWALRDQIDCRVKLLFQPSEESSPSGARTMVEHGVMDDIDCIAMCHVNTNDMAGVFSCCDGVTNASSCRFLIRMIGRGVHVAVPHQGVDAIAMGVKVYEGLQQIISRELDPFAPCVLGVCTINGGTTTAQVAGMCELAGSIRAMSDDTVAFVRGRADRLAHAVAEYAGGECQIEWTPGLPAAYNDTRMYKALTESARRALGHDMLTPLLPSTGGEDFVYYEKKKPGVLFGLGMRNPDKGFVHPAHTDLWDIEESAMESGVRVFVQFILDHMDGAFLNA